MLDIVMLREGRSHLIMESGWLCILAVYPDSILFAISRFNLSLFFESISR